VLPNPRVRTLEGHIQRLDTLLAERWALLARDRDPSPPPGWPSGRPTAALVVVEPGGFRRAAGLSTPAVEDLDGALLALLGRAGDRICVARPDRFLVGVDTPVRLADALSALCVS
jgi:3-(3-hydroxy-phenyl)propionate hydroxylase